MAVQFDETSDELKLAGSTLGDVPATDWSIWLWTKVDDNTGTAFQYLFSTGNTGEAGSIQLLLGETSDNWSFRCKEDAAGGTAEANISSSTTPGGDGVLRLIGIQRDTTAAEFQLWFCEYGGTASKEASVTDSGHSLSTAPGDFTIGTREVGPTDRYYGGILGDVFRYNAALSTAQIEALGRGMSPNAIGETLVFWFPFTDARSPVENLVDRTAQPSGANFGSDAIQIPRLEFD